VASKGLSLSHYMKHPNRACEETVVSKFADADKGA
jgi:hypothetical protein